VLDILSMQRCSRLTLRSVAVGWMPDSSRRRPDTVWRVVRSVYFDVEPSRGRLRRAQLFRWTHQLSSSHVRSTHDHRAIPAILFDGGKRTTVSLQACRSLFQKAPGVQFLRVEDAPIGAIRARDWLPILSLYRAPNHVRSVTEIAITVVPFALLWIAAWACLRWSYFLSLAVAVLAAGFLVRLFMIQHDCGHGSFFRQRLANDWAGRVISVLTLTPYDHWRHTHAVHHASSGNLERRGIGDIAMLTVCEYLALPRWRRIAYRLYRHPLVMFGIGPAYLFLVRHRFPAGGELNRWQTWLSPMATNAAIVLCAVVAMWLVGVRPFLLVHVPITLLAASIGVWLFYVQHQFEGTFWARTSSWTVHEAALHGSSHYDLPAVLRWFTANIGMHHVHHLCSRIPYYRLARVLHDHPELKDVGRITLLQSVGCVRLVLWDEARRRMISFRQLRDAGRERRSVVHHFR
jgi:acyl-lipid omega-6 desaturase (Delta-12 desaturase)